MERIRDLYAISLADSYPNVVTPIHTSKVGLNVHIAWFSEILNSGKKKDYMLAVITPVLTVTRRLDTSTIPPTKTGKMPYQCRKGVSTVLKGFPRNMAPRVGIVSIK